MIIDFSKYLNRVVSIDPDTRTAIVEPGANLDALRDAAAEHGLTFGPDPATHDRNTLGGMIGNNSCGVHSVMAELYGVGPLTADQVRSLDILTYDGHRMTVGATTEAELEQIIAGDDRRAEIYRSLRDLRDDNETAIRTGFPDIPRRVSGFNLDRLLPDHGFDVAKALVGTEGTCVVLLRATVTLMDSKPERTLVVLGYPDAYTAGDHVPMIRQHRPVGLEGIDRKLIGYMQKKGLHPDDVDLLPEGDGFLLVEMGGDTKADSDNQARALIDAVSGVDDPPTTKLFTDEWEEQKLWQVRESGLGATAQVPGLPRTHPGWEDAAVPPDRVGEYLRDFRDLLHEFDYEASLYGHFGQGCIHCRIDFDLSTAHGVTQWRQFLDRAADLVVSYGGSLSGEHGDGQARAALLGKMYSQELVEAFAAFKDIWDPDGRMNPGKVVRPHQPTDDLRDGPYANLRRVRTHFAFPDDDFDFAKPPAAASAWASAATWAPAPCAPATWPPGKRRTPPAVGPACCSSCSGATSSTAGAATRSPTRSTSAWRARGARATARSTSTWPPTRPSSCPTTTPGACGPASATPWGSSTGGPVSPPWLPAWSTPSLTPPGSRPS